MLNGNNERNYWMWSHNSVAFYDRFYQLQQENNSKYQMTNTCEYELTRNENTPEEKLTNASLTHASRVVDKDSDVEVVYLSSQMTETTGLKRQLSEAENTNEEVNSEETSSKRKHKKQKKHKHSRPDRGKEVSRIEIEKSDVICLDDDVVIEEVNTCSSDKSNSKNSHKHRKHKRKHKERSQKVAVTAGDMEEDVACLDEVAESAGTEQGIFAESDSGKPNQRHRHSKHGKKSREKNYMAEDNYYASEKSKERITEEDSAYNPMSSKRTPYKQREKRKLVKDVISALDDSGCYTVDLTSENSPCQIPESNIQQVTDFHTDESITGKEKKEKNLPALNTTLDTACDMDIASSPTVGGILYVNELEQDLPKDADKEVAPSVGNVLFATDLEKQWLQDSVHAREYSDLPQSGNTGSFQSWQWPKRSHHQWQYQSTTGIHLHTQENRFQTSFNDLRTRGFHTSFDPWQRDRSRASPHSPQADSAEVTIDISKPYSGSDGKRLL